jgi:hypothetical protein
MAYQTARALRDFLDQVLPSENGEPKSPFSVTINLTAELLSGVLCSALEGGSNYWYWIDEFVEPSAWLFESEPKPEKGTHYAQDYALNPGGALIISDQGDDDEDQEAKRLDTEAIQRGLIILAEKYPHHFANILSENYDAYTGDALLQCSLFGELVYG